MQTEKMGQFISELRKSKNMTQKDLADKLHITDKAVSKWERGLSCPDISLLTSIAGVLGVTVGELLNGERDCSDRGGSEVAIDSALHYADTTVKNREKLLRNIYGIAFTVSLLIGVIVCVICDLAISGDLSWSLLVLCASFFSWLVFFPVINYGGKGVLATLVAFSVLIIPYLYLLSCMVSGTNLIFTIGVRMAIISIIYLWCIYGIFKIFKQRKLLATAICLLLVIPICLLINFILANMLSVPVFDMWDGLSFLIILVVALVFWGVDCAKWKKLHGKGKE